MYTEIKCPSCLNTLEADDIKPKERRGNCSNCGHLFDVSKDIDIRIRKKYEIHQPKEIEMLKTDAILELELPMVILPKGCSFWPVFGGVAGVLMIIFLLLWYVQLDFFKAFYGFGIDYVLLCLFLGSILFVSFSIASQVKRLRKVSQIDIKAERDKLSINHIDKKQKSREDSAPQRMNKVLSPADITQFYAVEHSMSGHYFYTLSALDKLGKEIEIIPIVKNLQMVLFAEQELEIFYNIQDKKIEKEVNV